MLRLRHGVVTGRRTAIRTRHRLRTQDSCPALAALLYHDNEIIRVSDVMVMRSVLPRRSSTIVAPRQLRHAVWMRRRHALPYPSVRFRAGDSLSGSPSSGRTHWAERHRVVLLYSRSRWEPMFASEVPRRASLGILFPKRCTGEGRVAGARLRRRARRIDRGRGSSPTRVSSSPRQHRMQRANEVPKR